MAPDAVKIAIAVGIGGGVFHGVKGREEIADEKGTPEKPVSRVLRLVFCLAWMVVLAYFTILPFCGLLFTCGCNWAQGITQCNIFQAQQPDCPWCSLGMAGFWRVFGLIVGLSGATVWAVFRWIRSSISIGLITAALGYWWWGSLVGLGTALYRGYPVFYGVTLHLE